MSKIFGIFSPDQTRARIQQRRNLPPGKDGRLIDSDEKRPEVLDKNQFIAPFLIPNGQSFMSGSRALLPLNIPRSNQATDL